MRVALLAAALVVAGCSSGSPAAKPQPVSEASVQRQTALAADYVTWVRQQIAAEQTATTRLTSAVRAGDLEAARRAYPAARINYERIEPVAESFGDLDTALDARVGDVLTVAKWSGYHRLENALFADGSLAGMRQVADRLDADVRRLTTRAEDLSLTAPDLARGAAELLQEIARTKVTGEEEAYSHIDLVDFQANLDGARVAFERLSPVLPAGLVTELTSRFASVQQGLDRFRTGTGPTAFASYTTVTAADRRDLSQRLDALAEKVSELGPALVIGS